MAFEPGQNIGDYEIVARLGAGGQGAVYEVQHLVSRRREAMKIVPAEQGTPEMVQTLTTLNHVNIARVHHAFSYENHLVIVMELIHGETVRDLRERMGITMRQALDYMEQTLKALGYAHRLGVVHGDIKPSNIMITSGGFVKLLDFGIASAGAGSRNYMSPEQISGSKATPRSDIYSVGVTLYELLTGTLPINGDNQVPVRLNQLAPEVPGVVSDAVMRALARDPGERFATAEDFLHALRLTTTSVEPGNTYIGPFPVSRMASARTPISATDTSWPAAPAGSAAPQIVSVDEISRKLAAYIGPVAKFVVKKLAAQSEDLDFIYREAAKEIPSEGDRAAFLRSRRL
jgi:serine/threonine protein kinase